MKRLVVRVVFWTAVIVALGVSLFAAPTDSIGRTLEWVLFVESPLLVLVVMAVHWYVEWEQPR